MKNSEKKHAGWGALKVESWREAERSLKATHDPTMPITLPRLRFMENNNVEWYDQGDSVDDLLHGVGEIA